MRHLRTRATHGVCAATPLATGSGAAVVRVAGGRGHMLGSWLWLSVNYREAVAKVAVPFPVPIM